MTRLVQLQRELQRHLLTMDDTIVVNICASPATPAATRLKIYSDAYRLRLIEALASNYPVLARTLSCQDFATLAQCYLAQHPSRHFSIRWFGDRLADFVASDDTYGEQLWLRELVAWEWATATAFDVTDVELLQISDLSAITAEDWPTLSFKPHPSLRRMSLQTDVVALIQAAVASETAPVPTVSASVTQWCLWREDLTVRYRSLDAGEASAVDVLLKEGSFADICSALAEHTDTSQVPLLAASLLKTWIGAQWLAEFDH